MSSWSTIGQILKDHDAAWAKLVEINMERGRELDRAAREYEAFAKRQHELIEERKREVAG